MNQDATKMCCTLQVLKLETTNVTPLTEATYSQLLEAKMARIALGGAYLHQEQAM